MGVSWGVFIFVTLFLSYQAYKLHLHKQLYEYVRWCTVNDSHTRSNLTLLNLLHNAFVQANKKSSDYFFPKADRAFPIPEKFYFKSAEECKIVSEILSLYQQDLVQQYFEGTMKPDRSIGKLANAEFFLVTLKNFLKKHQLDLTFNGKTMYTTERKNNYTLTYKLSDYATVYYKIFLVAMTHCNTLTENHASTNSAIYNEIETIKKAIDTGEIEVMRG